MIAFHSNFNVYHHVSMSESVQLFLLKFQMSLGMASFEPDRTRSRSRSRGENRNGAVGDGSPPPTLPDMLSKTADSRPKRPFTPAMAEVHTIMSLIRDVEEHRSLRMNGLVGAGAGAFFFCGGRGRGVALNLNLNV